MRLPLVALTALLTIAPAVGHDRFGNANWIADGHFMSPIDGSHCCGPADCAEVPPEFVKEANGGYIVKGEIKYPGSIWGVNEWIPPREVQASKDGRFWRCKKPDGSRRCFFAQPPGS